MISTTILRDGNILSDWQLLSLPCDMNKFNLDDVYNCVSNTYVIFYLYFNKGFYLGYHACKEITRK